jgi:hypothetical protein
MHQYVCVVEVGFSSFRNIVPSSAYRGRRNLGHAFAALQPPKEPSWKAGSALVLQVLDCVIREMQSCVLSIPRGQVLTPRLFYRIGLY